MKPLKPWCRHIQFSHGMYWLRGPFGPTLIPKSEKWVYCPKCGKRKP